MTRLFHSTVIALRTCRHPGGSEGSRRDHLTHTFRTFQPTPPTNTSKAQSCRRRALLRRTPPPNQIRHREPSTPFFPNLPVKPGLRRTLTDLLHHLSQFFQRVSSETRHHSIEPHHKRDHRQNVSPEEARPSKWPYPWRQPQHCNRCKGDGHHCLPSSSRNLEYSDAFASFHRIGKYSSRSLLIEVMEGIEQCSKPANSRRNCCRVDRSCFISDRTPGPVFHRLEGTQIGVLVRKSDRCRPSAALVQSPMQAVPRTSAARAKIEHRDRPRIIHPAPQPPGNRPVRVTELLQLQERVRDEMTEKQRRCGMVVYLLHGDSFQWLQVCRKDRLRIAYPRRLFLRREPGC